MDCGVVVSTPGPPGSDCAADEQQEGVQVDHVKPRPPAVDATDGYIRNVSLAPLR